MKKNQAAKIAEELTDTRRWRTHGRSIKRQDLEGIGLRITRVDDDEELADIVYRIQMLIALVLSSTAVYKILSTADGTINRQAMPIGMPVPQQQQAAFAEIDHKCSKCGKKYKYYLKFIENAQIDQDMKDQGRKPLPQKVVKCNCGTEIPVDKMRSETETRTGIKPI
jgi:hypothetical protein